MKRLSTISILVAASGLALFFASKAESQVGPPKAYVGLQPTTPGTSQSGHLNVSGTIRSSQLFGGGSGITNVNADLLDGINSTAFLQTVPIPLTLGGSSTSHIIRGENTSTDSLASGVFGFATAVTGGASGVSGQTLSTSGRAVTGWAVSPSGTTFGGHFTSSSSSGRGVYGEASALSGSNIGVYGRSNSPTGMALYGYADATSGQNYGAYGDTESTTGMGVRGRAQAATGVNYGGFFASNSDTGHGVYGEATSATGATFGGKFISGSTTGTGVYGAAGRYGVRGNGVFGVIGETTGTDPGYGVHGASYATTGQNYGGNFSCSSPAGTGVFGVNEAATGNAIGAYGESHSTTGRGVYGVTTAATGVNYGVRGFSASAASGYAVYANGDLGASGVKSFRIDHPFDPENKYLLHYSSESPAPQNFYVGNVVTDAKGYAWVELPDYFQEINANFKYQLTVVDESDSNEFIWVKVVQKIKGCHFRIRTNLPNIEVSWRVDADRNDLFVRDRKPKDVIEKEDSERGKYQHPELYGLPKERGMDFQADLPLKYVPRK